MLTLMFGEVKDFNCIVRPFLGFCWVRRKIPLEYTTLTGQSNVECPISFELTRNITKVKMIKNVLFIIVSIIFCVNGYLSDTRGLHWPSYLIKSKGRYCM
jgi:hypothetical protein